MNDNTDSPGTAPSLHPDYQEPVVGLSGFPTPAIVQGEVVRITDLPERVEQLVLRPARYKPLESDWLRRFVEDPSWLLVGLGIAVPGVILGIVIKIVLGIADSGPVTIISALLTIALALWVLSKLRRGRGHQCQGLHCPGCGG
ncbi:MAG: hypothetical protein ACREQ5_12280 [Candidatus Dormibacteria bacterium]